MTLRRGSISLGSISAGFGLGLALNFVLINGLVVGGIRSTVVIIIIFRVGVLT
jgi:hypothetical protein